MDDRVAALEAELEADQDPHGYKGRLAALEDELSVEREKSQASQHESEYQAGRVAEFERDLIRERTRAGMAAAKRRGKRVGRPRVHVPVTKARLMLDSGESYAVTARKLGISRSTLARALPKRVSAATAASSRS